jgi:hypothetical protein
MSGRGRKSNALIKKKQEEEQILVICVVVVLPLQNILVS